MRWPFLFLLFTVGVVLIDAGHISWAEEEANFAQTFSLPPDPMYFKPGAGQDVANSFCLICHSADYVYIQPLLSQERWQSLVLKMKNEFGCPIPDDQISLLSAYLFEQNRLSSGTPEQHP